MLKQLWLTSLALVVGALFLTRPSSPFDISALEGATVPFKCVHNKTLCTAFSINQQRGYYMSAAHCLIEGTPFIDGHPSQLLFQDDALDVAVFRTESFRWALPPSRKPIVVTERLMAYGYGYGLAQPLFKELRVAGVNIAFANDSWSLVDSSVIPGMSGGPIINLRGEVVGLVQQSDTLTSGFRSFDLIYKATQKYWER